MAAKGNRPYLRWPYVRIYVSSACDEKIAFHFYAQNVLTFLVELYRRYEKPYFFFVCTSNFQELAFGVLFVELFCSQFPVPNWTEIHTPPSPQTFLHLPSTKLLLHFFFSLSLPFALPPHPPPPQFYFSTLAFSTHVLGRGYNIYPM
jgi:hypothetical protein